jgi:hypothetical protein
MLGKILLILNVWWLIWYAFVPNGALSRCRPVSIAARQIKRRVVVRRVVAIDVTLSLGSN